jgi:predicted small lipoprotein YifL
MTALGPRNTVRHSLHCRSTVVRGFPFVPHSRLKLGRAVLVAGLLGLALSACGRKGPLEAPPNAANAIDLPDDQIGAVENRVPTETTTSPIAKPPKTNRAVTIPNKSFVLDPLL